MFRYILCIFLLCSSSLAYAASVDTTIGLTAPKEVARNYKKLAHFLCDGLAGDEAKANAIYNWITHNIRYDAKALQTGKLKPAQPEKVLKARMGVCEGYARLFTAMCKEAGLKAMNIDGYAKDWMFDNGTRIYIPRHMWAAVQINGKWQFTDPTWGAGGLVQAPPWWQKIINKFRRKKLYYAKKMKFKFHYDPTYFEPAPEVFCLKHLPADPVWQLADSTMPLSVFEAGDSEVIRFNNQYAKIRQHNDSLVRISDQDEDSSSYYAAERTYAYNPRFPASLAVKQSLRAQQEMKKIFGSNDDSVTTEMLLANAIRALKTSEEHLKEQKKYIPEEYNELKKKNRDKSTDARQYVTKIKSDNKKLIAQCTQYQNAADTKAERIRKKVALASARKREIDLQKIDDQSPSKSQKPAHDPEMLALTDSIKERKYQIDSIEGTKAACFLTINTAIEENTHCLEALYAALILADSYLVKEAGCRLSMMDNNDDEVIYWSTLFKEKKYVQADSLHKAYLSGYDTTINYYERLQKLQIVQYDLYKKNLHDLEKYAKWKSDDSTVKSSYLTIAANYLSAIDTGAIVVNTGIRYMNFNKKLFAGLSKIYKRQLTITDYMNNAEKMRKRIEQSTIAGRQKFDNKENNRQTAGVRKGIKELQGYLKKT